MSKHLPASGRIHKRNARTTANTGRIEEKADKVSAVSEEFKRFADRSRDVVYRYDLSSRRYVFWNKVGLLTYGSDDGAEQPTKKNVVELIHPDDLKKVRAASKRSLASGRGSGEVEYRIRYRDGSIRWMHDRWIVVRDRLGRSVAIEGVVRDDTERKQAETALRESRERYRRLVETMNDGLVVADAGEVLTYVNERFCTMLGYAAEELVGHPIVGLIHPGDRNLFREQVSRRKKGERKPYEINWMARGGREIPTIVSPEPMFDEAGNFDGSFAVVTDIGEQKAIQRMLKAREKELEGKTRNLEDLISALEVLLRRREEDKHELQRSILQGTRELIEPYMAKLKRTQLDQQQNVLINIIEANLKEVIASCSDAPLESRDNLSAAESQVANLVRIGRSTKEIADILHVSTRTVESHRYNIRRKLGIRHSSKQLRTHLLAVAANAKDTEMPGASGAW